MKRKIVKESALFDEMASQFVKAAKMVLRSNERFTVALSGGKTPRNFYRKLVSEDFRDRVDWERVDFFFGDERDVSPMSERSNFRMANEFLFKPLSIKKKQVFRWQTEIIEVSEVAASYEKTIRRYFNLKKRQFPVIDLMYLGMGDDGHTASIFPFTDAVDEKERIAISNRVEKFDSYRLTLTFPTINHARRIVVAVTGADKAGALKAVLEGPKNCAKFPAQCVKPVKGTLFWLIGESAAKGLTGKAAGR